MLGWISKSDELGKVIREIGSAKDKIRNLSIEEKINTILDLLF